MANRQFQQYRYSLEKSVVDLFCDVTFGVSGAPTLVVANSKGIKSVVRNSAGRYTITLQDSYFKFLGLETTFINATAPAAAGRFVVSQNVKSVTAPTIVIQFNTSGTATDPASGEECLVHLKLGNSSAP